MRAEGSDEWAKARNSNIIEDLGRVGYVFSDKTGTLTSNEMRMRALAIKGVPYGGTDFKCAPAAPGSQSSPPFPRGMHLPLSSKSFCFKAQTWRRGIQRSLMPAALDALHRRWPRPHADVRRALSAPGVLHLPVLNQTAEAA